MNMKKAILLIFGIYVVICILLYFIQEKLLFHPTQLSKDYKFNFTDEFEELNLKTNDGIMLNAVHFKSKEKIGIVLFLHGNGGAIDTWGHTSKIFTNNGYDVLYLDYRSYGKSEGKIISELQLINDAQLAYDYLKNQFDENNIIISGTSMGTGMAAILASQNTPQKLILHAPYSNLSKLIIETVKIVPKPIIKYKFETEKHLATVKCPIYAFHGDQDRVIPVHHAMNLKALYDDIDLTILKGYEHNNITNSKVYLEKIREILK